MTLTKTQMHRSAVEIQGDDGAPVATIYATRAGVEIVCQQGWTAEYTADRDLITRLSITFEAITEARRR